MSENTRHRQREEDRCFANLNSGWFLDQVYEFLCHDGQLAKKNSQTTTQVDADSVEESIQLDIEKGGPTEFPELSQLTSWHSKKICFSMQGSVYKPYIIIHTYSAGKWIDFEYVYNRLLDLGISSSRIIDFPTFGMIAIQTDIPSVDVPKLDSLAAELKIIIRGPCVVAIDGEFGCLTKKPKIIKSLLSKGLLSESKKERNTLSFQGIGIRDFSTLMEISNEKSVDGAVFLPTIFLHTVPDENEHLVQDLILQLFPTVVYMSIHRLSNTIFKIAVCNREMIKVIKTAPNGSFKEFRYEFFDDPSQDLMRDSALELLQGSDHSSIGSSNLGCQISSITASLHPLSLYFFSATWNPSVWNGSITGSGHASHLAPLLLSDSSHEREFMSISRSRLVYVLKNSISILKALVIMGSHLLPPASLQKVTHTHTVIPPSTRNRTSFCCSFDDFLSVMSDETRNRDDCVAIMCDQDGFLCARARSGVKGVSEDVLRRTNLSASIDIVYSQLSCQPRKALQSCLNSCDPGLYYIKDVQIFKLGDEYGYTQSDKVVPINILFMRLARTKEIGEPGPEKAMDLYSEYLRQALGEALVLKKKEVIILFHEESSGSVLSSLDRMAPLLLQYSSLFQKVTICFQPFMRQRSQVRRLFSSLFNIQTDDVTDHDVVLVDQPPVSAPENLTEPKVSEPAPTTNVDAEKIKEDAQDSSPQDFHKGRKENPQKPIPAKVETKPQQHQLPETKNRTTSRSKQLNSGSPSSPETKQPLPANPSSPHSKSTIILDHDALQFFSNAFENPICKDCIANKACHHVQSPNPRGRTVHKCPQGSKCPKLDSFSHTTKFFHLPNNQGLS